MLLIKVVDNRLLYCKVIITEASIKANTQIDCCPYKKIWGSANPSMDGWYMNVGSQSSRNLPENCNSPCVYKRSGSNDGLLYCFANSDQSQSSCEEKSPESIEGKPTESYEEFPGSGSKLHLFRPMSQLGLF